jgi:hypothetical protein
MPTDPHCASFQQPGLHSTQRRQPQESLRLYTCHYGSNLIGVCRDHHVRHALWTFTCSHEVAHVIHNQRVNQRREEIAQAGDHGLLGAGRGMQGGQFGQVGAQGIE